jgi:putative molybdopterin biosynthesis protein
LHFTRRIYQTNISLDEAFKIWFEFISAFRPAAAEEILVADSLGRVTAGAVQAKISSPFFHASAMDGYAVRFVETFGASETNPLRLRLHDQAVPVNTGDPIPSGFNAVIMIEEVNLTEYCIEITEAVTPYKHIRPVGEDIVQTELILPENHVIRPVDIGAMLSGGDYKIMVRRKPVVTVIPTGNEIVEPGAPLKTGNIIDSNSYMIGNLVIQWGGEFRKADIVQDNRDLLKQKILDASEKSDVVVVLAGASAGTKDFTPNAVEDLGTVLVHGINIKPGKPVLLGSINSKPVIGLPGYPVAAHMTFEFFGKPLICRLLGIEPARAETMKARLSRHVASSIGQEEFLRVKVGKVGDNFIATPVGQRRRSLDDASARGRYRAGPGNERGHCSRDRN